METSPGVAGTPKKNKNICSQWIEPLGKNEKTETVLVDDARSVGFKQTEANYLIKKVRTIERKLRLAADSAAAQQKCSVALNRHCEIIFSKK